MFNINRVIFFIFCSAFLGAIFSDCGNKNETTYKQGKRLYENYCANCHNENGTGLMSLVPPLAQVDYINIHRADLPCIIRKGLQGTITVNGKSFSVQNMPALDRFSPFEVTNILNYISSSWGNKEKPWTVDEVYNSFKNCPY